MICGVVSRSAIGRMGRAEVSLVAYICLRPVIPLSRINMSRIVDYSSRNPIVSISNVSRTAHRPSAKMVVDGKASPRVGSAPRPNIHAISAYFSGICDWRAGRDVPLASQPCGHQYTLLPRRLPQPPRSGDLLECARSRRQRDSVSCCTSSSVWSARVLTV